MAQAVPVEQDLARVQVDFVRMTGINGAFSGRQVRGGCLIGGDQGGTGGSYDELVQVSLELMAGPGTVLVVLY